MTESESNLLAVEDLRVRFRTADGWIRAVDGVSYTLRAGETLGIVGESGSGKTVSALSLLRLLESPPAEIASGRIVFEGRDLLTLSDESISDIRGRSISMVFQEPMTSLNPVKTMGSQVAETLVRHLRLSPGDARERTLELLDLVGIPSPQTNFSNHPHRFSGGMRQRVMIAMAIACEPRILIADEPTTALDVTIQAQILELMVGLQEKLATSIILITHDLAVIAETAHRVAVMYAGRIVELAPVRAIFETPRHPYTQGLLRSVPRIVRERPARLTEIAGTVPNLARLPAGCAFAERCDRADLRCRTEAPVLKTDEQGHLVSCWKASHG